MGNLKACIFDMDGVIIHSADFHFEAWRKLAKERGIVLEEQLKPLLNGLDRESSLEIVLNKESLKLNEEEKLALIEKKNNWYLQSIANLKQKDLLKGALPFLKECRSRNIKIALGSRSRNARFILEKTEILSYFDAVVDGNQVKRFKPNPEVFLKGAALIGVEPNEAVVFEDSVSGMKAARSGGFFCVGIGDSEKFPEANHVIDGLHQMNLEKLRSLFEAK